MTIFLNICDRSCFNAAASQVRLKGSKLIWPFLFFFSLEKSGIAGTESEKEKEKEGEDKDEKRDAAGDKDAAKKDEEMEVNYDFC